MSKRIKILYGALIVYQVILGIILFMGSSNKKYSLLLLGVLVVLSVVIDIYIFKSIKSSIEKKKIEEKMIELYKEAKVRKDYINSASKKLDTLKEYDSEYKKQLLEIKNQTDLTGTIDLVDEAIEYSQSIRFNKYCENAIANTVLVLKKQYAQDENIDMKISADLSKDISVEDKDICSLLCNLLDNAIEECERVENKEKSINVKIKQHAGYLFFHVDNTCDVSNEFTYKRKTKKLEKEEHGYGLKIVKEIVRKYEGDYKAVVNDRFITVVSLKV